MQVREGNTNTSNPAKGGDDDDPPNKPLPSWNMPLLPNPGIFKNIDCNVIIDSLLQRWAKEACLGGEDPKNFNSHEDLYFGMESSCKEFDKDSRNDNYANEEEPQMLKKRLWAPELLHNPVDLVLPVRCRRRNHDEREVQQPLPAREGGHLNGKAQQEEEEIPNMDEVDNPNIINLREPCFFDPWKLNSKV